MCVSRRDILIKMAEQQQQQPTQRPIQIVSPEKLSLPLMVTSNSASSIIDSAVGTVSPDKPIRSRRISSSNASTRTLPASSPIKV